MSKPLCSVPALRATPWIAALALALSGGTSVATAAPSPHPLRTAIADGDTYAGIDPGPAFARTRAAGARFVRLYLSWRLVAPGGSSKPAGFDARNPADPAYNWSVIDTQVRSAVGHGLAPILSVVETPTWAQQGVPPLSSEEGTYRPDPREYRDFATAVARRYSGRFPGLPRVRYFQAGNEPNVFVNLNPQYDTPANQPVTARSRPVSPGIYLALLNGFAAAVHAVHRDNTVIAGGLAPFGRYVAGGHNVAPMAFMRDLLCMNSRNRPVPGCRRRASFDVWAHDPYVDGGPTAHARFPDNVAIGDLPKMRRLLEAAIRAGKVSSRQRIQFWVAEFGWNTNPPAPGGVPPNVHARWVAEALYRMWRDGVSLITWFGLRDSVATGLLKQTGLYYRCGDQLACDQPKPALQAFHFPFVAYRAGRGVFVWGRTPDERPARVVIERQVGAGWRGVASLRADRYGVFTSTVATPPRGVFRARAGGSHSLGFSMRVPHPVGLHPIGLIGNGAPVEGS